MLKLKFLSILHLFRTIIIIRTSMHTINVLSRNVILCSRLHKHGNKKIRRFVLRGDPKGNAIFIDYLYLPLFAVIFTEINSSCICIFTVKCSKLHWAVGWMRPNPQNCSAIACRTVLLSHQCNVVQRSKVSFAVKKRCKSLIQRIRHQSLATHHLETNKNHWPSGVLHV